MSSLPARVEQIELVPATEDGLPWERLKGESRQAFANFAYFRDLGRERTIIKAADGVEKSKHTLYEQSVKYRWQDRVAAYDDYLDRRMRDELETERARVNREGAALFRQLQVVAGMRLLGDDSDPKRRVAPLNPNDLEASDVARLIETAWRGLRTATGQPTDFVAGKFGISGDDLLRIVQGLYDIAERLLPEERRNRLAIEFQAFLEGGGR